MSAIDIEKSISRLIEESVLVISPSFDRAKLSSMIRLEKPKDRSHGDLTTNIAMKLAGALSMPPLNAAENIKDAMLGAIQKTELGGAIRKIDAVRPGFINFWVSQEHLFDTLKRVKDEDNDFGRGKPKSLGKVVLEFVSANPTGPLTVAHGRQAAIGNAIGKILDFYGYEVTREYFINDEGRQINVLGESILHHYLSFYGISYAFPEDGYKGAYIKDIALEVQRLHGDKFVKDYENNKKFFSVFGADFILDIIKKDLEEFGVHFDSWFSQRTLTKELIMGVLEGLRKDGYVYDQDGATWFKATAFGDEKDRVVIKSDGSFTYFAPDIAYHKNKYVRGYDRVINMWGPDHHGYIPRLTAAICALGRKKEALSVLIVQLATLYKNGEVLSMSTRRGEFITLKEVMDEVGKDVAKFFFLQRKLDSHLDFDLDLAKKESSDNPVYYIQYAHARIWSIFEHAEKMKALLESTKLDLTLLKEHDETALARAVTEFPEYVKNSAVTLEPSYIILYLQELAGLFSTFYTKHKVVTDDASLTKARLFLVDCVRICLANGLSLLGVSLPKKM